MRKIFYIFILMVSSFFVFNNNVKADTLNYIIDEQDFTYLNDNFYKVRDLVIDYAETNNKYYIIYYDSAFYVYFFPKGTYTYQSKSYNEFIYPYINISVEWVDQYKYNSGALSTYGSYRQLTLALKNNNYENIFSYSKYLDTNIELLTGITEHTYTLTYNDFSYSFTSGEHFPSLYEFKTIMENPPVVKPEEPEELPRNESLDSFYSLLLEKIELFANYFITNTTLLFIIGIIILIFIIELIFRRYL